MEIVSAIDSNAKLLWTFAADSSAVGPIVMDKKRYCLCLF